ncbi:MAG: hypothetical protein KGH60_04860 [Candidatus Micrarchaeota archaeon]|nr:hypothetical protein [Candidatus Micrarchaeota archaeon]
MPEDINFIDLVALTRIGPETVVEKFGGVINSSFFDASNILATLKQKGLVDFTTSFPGQSAITVTELGKQTVSDAAEKAKANFDALDFAVITQLSGGKRAMNELTASLNIRPRDLAMHLYRLTVQQYVAYDFRNGIVDLSLTEKGFMRVKEGMVSAPQAAPAMPGTTQEPMLQPGVQAPQAATASAQPMQAPANGTVQPGQAGATIDMKELETRLATAKKRKIAISVVAAVVVIVIVVIALTMLNVVRL